MIKLAAAQLGPASEVKSDNVDRVEALLREAGRHGADLVVFPELALCPYFANTPGEDAGRWADDIATSDDVKRLLGVVAEIEAVCVLPLVEKSDGRLYNSALVADRDGTMRGVYQKAHIPGVRDSQGIPVSGEVVHFAAGESGFAVFDTAAGTVGVLICADRGYPEAWRTLALRGAQIVATPYNTSVAVPHACGARDPLAQVGRAQHLRMAAAALTNGYFVVAAGKGGEERGVRYLASSQIIDPWGRTTAEAAGAGDELIMAEVAVDAALRERNTARQLARRRPDLYGDLVKEYRP